MFPTYYPTKPSIKFLIWLLAACSLLAPIISFISLHIPLLIPPNVLFALSLRGILHGHIWQLFTYITIHSMSVHITLSLLFSLLFHLFLLWITSSDLSRRWSMRTFWLFFISATFICGLIGLAALSFTSPAQFVFGSSPPLFALLTIWVLYYPDLLISLFFVIRIKAKWLVTILFAISLFIHLSSNNIPLFFAELAGIGWGYLMGRWVWKLPQPFS